MIFLSPCPYITPANDIPLYQNDKYFDIFLLKTGKVIKMLIILFERGFPMNNKWILMLVGIVFSAMIAAGCNAEPDPVPPADDQNQVDQENGTTDNDGNTDDNLPGVDEDDTMMKDDEKDTDPDQEDVIEDVEDMGDKNNKDE